MTTCGITFLGIILKDLLGTTKESTTTTTVKHDGVVSWDWDCSQNRPHIQNLQTVNQLMIEISISSTIMTQNWRNGVVERFSQNFYLKPNKNLWKDLKRAVYRWSTQFNRGGAFFSKEEWDKIAKSKSVNCKLTQKTECFITFFFLPLFLKAFLFFHLNLFGCIITLKVQTFILVSGKGRLFTSTVWWTKSEWWTSK